MGTHQTMNFDKFLKTFMSDLSVAKDLLSYYLPNEILSLADLSGLSPLPQESISLGLQIKIGDLIYKVPPKNEGDPPFIFYIEAQTNFYKYFPLRLRTFEVNLQWDWVNAHEKIAMVIPIIISTSGKVCVRKPDYLDLFPENYKELMSNIATWSSFLIDFCALNQTEIESHTGLVAVVETVFSKIRTTSFKPLLEECIKYFKRAIQVDKNDFSKTSDHFSTVVCLLAEQCRDVPKGKEFKNYLISLEQQLPDKMGEKVMNMREELDKVARDEGMLMGRQQGLNEGMFMGKQEIIQNMIKSGMSLEQIVSCTGINRNMLPNGKN